MIYNLHLPSVHQTWPFSTSSSQPQPSVADATIAGSYSGSVPHDARVGNHGGGTVAGGPKKVRAVQVGPKDPGVGLT